MRLKLFYHIFYAYFIHFILFAYLCIIYYMFMQKLDMDGSSAASASKETGTGSSDTASTSYQQCMSFDAGFIQLILKSGNPKFSVRIL